MSIFFNVPVPDYTHTNTLPLNTAGLGLNLWLVNIDLGASLSPDTTTIDENDIPKEMRAELALSALF